jgi:hypothetical protein
MVCAKAGKFTKLFDAFGNIYSICVVFEVYDYEKERHLIRSVFAQYSVLGNMLLCLKFMKKKSLVFLVFRFK